MPVKNISIVQKVKEKKKHTCIPALVSLIPSLVVTVIVAVATVTVVVVFVVVELVVVVDKGKPERQLGHVTYMIYL